MNPFFFRLAPVLLGALALAPSAPAQLSQRHTQPLPTELPASFGISAPEGSGSYQAFGNFGRLVDAYGDRLIIADDTEVYIYNLTTGSFESTSSGLSTPGLIASTSNGPALSIDSIDIGDDVAHVSFVKGPAGTARIIQEFSFENGFWSQAFGLQSTSLPGFDYFQESYQGRTYEVQAVPSGVFLAVHDGGLGAATITSINSGVPAGRVGTGLAVGDGPNGDTLIVLSTKDGSDHFFDTYTFDGATITPYDAIDDFWGFSFWGEAVEMAVAKEQVILAFPETTSFEGVVVFCDGAIPNEYTFSYSQAGTPVAGGDFGTSLAVSDDGEVLAVGAIESDILAAGSQVGATHLFRYDATSMRFVLSGEVYHVADNDFTSERLQGASVALPDGLVVSGAPGGTSSAGYVSIQKRYVNSITASGIGLGGIDSLGTQPTGQVRGMPFDGAPTCIEVRDGPSSTPGLLFFGLDVAAVPFKTGVLYPNPLIQLMLNTNSSGALMLTSFWDASAPGPYTLHMQYWGVSLGGWSGTPGFFIRQPE